MTYYDILGVTPDTSIEDIRVAWRKIAKRLHPDNQQTGNAAQFKRAKEAYEVIGDLDKRAEYDRFLMAPEPEPQYVPQAQAAYAGVDEKGPALSEVLGHIVDGLAGTYFGNNPSLRTVYRGFRPKVQNELKRIFREENRVKGKRKAAAR